MPISIANRTSIRRKVAALREAKVHPGAVRRDLSIEVANERSITRSIIIIRSIPNLVSPPTIVALSV